MDVHLLAIANVLPETLADGRTVDLELPSDVSRCLIRQDAEYY